MPLLVVATKRPKNILRTIPREQQVVSGTDGLLRLKQGETKGRDEEGPGPCRGLRGAEECEGGREQESARRAIRLGS